MLFLFGVSVIQSPAESSFSLTIPSREYCVLFLSGVSVLQSPSESSFSLTIPSREYCVLFLFSVSVLQSPSESSFSLTIPSRECMCCYCLMFQSYNPQQRVYVPWTDSQLLTDEVNTSCSFVTLQVLSPTKLTQNK